MDSKGLDVCNSRERDKMCWCGCCLDGRKAACLTVLTVLLSVCMQRGTSSVYCYKTRRGNSNKKCRIFGDQHGA